METSVLSESTGIKIPYQIVDLWVLDKNGNIFVKNIPKDSFEIDLSDVTFQSSTLEGVIKEATATLNIDIPEDKLEKILSQVAETTNGILIRELEYLVVLDIKKKNFEPKGKFVKYKEIEEIVYPFVQQNNISLHFKDVYEPLVSIWKQKTR